MAAAAHIEVTTRTLTIQDSTSGTTIIPSPQCAENNPWQSIIPNETSADDRILSQFRTIDLKNNRLAIHLKDFVRGPDGSRIDIDPDLYDSIGKSGRMSFVSVGCTGDPGLQHDQSAVAEAMIESLSLDGAPSFLLHLGDVTYKPELSEILEDGDGMLKGGRLMQSLYMKQFYGMYRGFHRPIFALAGNHDGKYKYVHDLANRATDIPDLGKSPMWHFLKNFCATKREFFPDNQDANGDQCRSTMTQPYPYYLIDTPAAHIIVLYTNVLNGGGLDLNHTENTQASWLDARLKELKVSQQSDGRPVIVATHYPPFSGAPNFVMRGDPQAPTTPGEHPSRPLASVLIDAFAKADMWPDLILSAHAHHYQRLTYNIKSIGAEGISINRQIPMVIAGCGGHSPIEHLWRNCDGTNAEERFPPFPAVMPPGFTLPAGHSVELTAYNDLDFGYLNVTIDLYKCQLTVEYRTTGDLTREISPGRCRNDVCQVDIRKHT